MDIHSRLHQSPMNHWVNNGDLCVIHWVNNDICVKSGVLIAKVVHGEPCNHDYIAFRKDDLL